MHFQSDASRSDAIKSIAFNEARQPFRSNLASRLRNDKCSLHAHYGSGLPRSLDPACFEIGAEGVNETVALVHMSFRST